ncbi:UDP-N-acetylmuramoyl-L-alanine--D-glutamate ligase [Telmatospirillum siberiense]|uniref:UDP-N-acetylmuramoylalanine--D-glutamate ligase n=1 Tax=Telmatospirillum siberiense TaxID=382514 RepID=A0A2N3PQK6_9PROT|nr:UDP-N-acetylmuramoyl-L-alanine--D-glutamate ligase [Telmatospirillum siberiense]PKU22686.1 UDP-N-acetylmuramoyl-L-alanine--D-glutamate ligase [Telmatospirillum siberiense]
MALVPFLRGETVAVMGLGKSGVSAARALMESGVRVVAWDDKPEARAAGQAAGLVIGDPATLDVSALRMVVWSPGIPHTHPRRHPFAERARQAGVPLVCDVELLAMASPAARFVGITGTNGKSTTTTLTAHIFQAAGRAVAAGGNLGTPALDLPTQDSEGTYVLELSSYQIELLDHAGFDIALLLNLTPDHLARHGGMEGYVAAKAGLFDRMRPGGVSIVGIDDEHSRAIFERLRKTDGACVIPISVEGPAAGGVSAKNGILVDDCGGEAVEILDLRTLPHLPGRHNWQNACASYAAARAAGLSPDVICRGLKSYPGLAHRQESVAEIDGIAYVNDSKATNADAVEKALVCYDTVYWILGGQSKEGGITSLVPLFPRIARAFLIGEASDEFALTLEGKVGFERCGTLDVAVGRARDAALADGKPGAVVLLSPACASWDQFSSFEHRGERFRQLVGALPGKRNHDVPADERRDA